MSVINKTQLQKLFTEELDSDSELFENLFIILKSQYEQLQKIIIKEDSLQEVAELAHKVKSGSRSFGADLIVEHLETLESESKNKDIDSASKTLIDVQKLLKPSINEIQLFIEEKKA